MKRTIAFLSLAAISALALAACSDSVPTPTYGQSRAIDQDIDATHVVGPTTTSPAFTDEESVGDADTVAQRGKNRHDEPGRANRADTAVATTRRSAAYRASSSVSQ